MLDNRLASLAFRWTTTAALTVWLSVAHAQTTGTIVGQVFDPTGASIVGANVEAQNVDTGLKRKGSTNAEGTYLIPSLPPGNTRSPSKPQVSRATVRRASK